MTGTRANERPRGGSPTKGMSWIPEGTFSMGCEDFYPDEAPVRAVWVDPFWMDQHPVTVAEFRRFVKATGHVTMAERAPDAADYPDGDPSLLVPGSLVFVPPTGPVDLRDFRNWWAWVPGADWRHPDGPASTLDGRDRHPVTQVAYDDAVGYAAWAGKELPTEAEWERAARGGLEGAIYPWGDDFTPRGRFMANTWQGQFPWQNLVSDRYGGTSPVRSYPPNSYGLYDVVGNVWEWTADFFATPDSRRDEHACCGPHHPGPNQDDPTVAVPRPDDHLPRKVIKGGSHLCAPNYCLRYRPAARQSQSVDTSTTHIGFRCVVRP